MNREDLKNDWKNRSSKLLLELHTELRDIANLLNNDEKNFKISDYAVIEFISEWLKILEGIALLFSEGLVDVSQVLTRSLFEATLQLCYLVSSNDEIDNKAACYYVISSLHAYSLNKKLIKLKEQVGDASIEGIAKNKEIIKSIDANQDNSIREIFNYIKNEKIIDKDWNKMHWYEFYAFKYNKGIGRKDYNIRDIGKKTLINLYTFCKIVDFYDDSNKKILMYDLIYPMLSRQSHGFASRDQVKYYDGLQNFRETDCLQNGLWQLKVINEMFKKVIRDIPKTYKDLKYQDNIEFLSRNYNRKLVLEELASKLGALY